MKNNLTTISTLCVMLFSLFTINSSHAQGCIPAGPMPLHGTTVSGGDGTVVNLTAVQVGTVIEINCPAAGLEYSVDMCATNAPGWLDDTNDSRITVLDVNSAAAVSLGGMEDGCTDFEPGQNGYGPSFGSWSSPAAGTYYFYVTEWANGTTTGCDIATGNNAYVMDITIANAPSCANADAGTASADDTCVDFGNTYSAISAGAVVPGANPQAGFAWLISSAPLTTPTDPYNDPALLGNFAFQDAPYDVAFVNDGNQIPAGTYYFTAIVAGNATTDAAGAVTATDPACTFATTSLMVEFKADGALCGGGGIDCSQAMAGTITSDECIEFNGTWSGTSTGAVVPAADSEAGFIWALYSGTITTPADPLNDPAFLGVFGVDPSPGNVALLNDGSQIPAGVYSAYTITFGNATTNADGTITFDPACTFISNELVFELKADGASCAGPTCTTPTATASYDCTTGAVVVDVTDAGTPSDGSAGYEITVLDQTQAITDAGAYSFTLPAGQTFTVNISDNSGDPDCDVELSLIADCTEPCDGAIEGLTDGGFEEPQDAVWAEVSTTPDGADTGFGIVATQLPLGGAQSAWFGGFGTDGSITSLSQSITIPTNVTSATFSFWALEFGDCEAGDVLSVDIDGTVEFTQDGTNPNCGSSEWHLYTIDLSAYADGVAHDLTITYNQLAMVTNSNLFVDDASLTICPCPELTLSTSSTPETCSDASGTATVTATGGTGYSYLWDNGMETETATGLSVGTHSVTVTDDATGCEAVATATVTNELSTTALTVTTSSMGEACGSLDGTATVDAVDGGSGNYTYFWINGETSASVSGLSAGIYPVTVTDAATGCSGVGSATISSIGGPSVVIDDVFDASCSGGDNGSITITVADGTPPYTYNWSNGQTDEDITGLTAGDYTGTVTDDNGCSFVVNATVNEPSLISVTIDNVMDATCNGGTDGGIMISVSGGTAPYTFMWSNGADTEDVSDLLAGDYTGTITDANGCELVSDAITIAEPDAIVVTVDGTTDVTCNGGVDGSIMITVSGGTAPYSFTWSDGSISEDPASLSAGDYTVTITDAIGCETIANPIVVSGPDAITITTDEIIDDAGSNDGAIMISVAGGTAPYTYAWSNGEATEDLMDLAVGDYTVTVTDNNDCELVATLSVGGFGVHVDDITSISSFSLNPNPTTGDVRIAMSLDNQYDVQLEVFDMTGRSMLTERQSNSTDVVFDIDLSNFSDGVYFARFIVDGQTFTERIVKSN